MTFASVVADTLQHAVRHDTVLVHDTVRVTDTVRVLVRDGGLSVQAWLGIVLAALPIAGGTGWKLRGLLIERRHAHQRINAEAVLLHRELKAGLGQGPEEDQYGVWAEKCQRGFDLEQERFTRLLDLALNASREVRRLVREERQRFLDAANVVNESLVGMWDANRSEAMKGVCRELQKCVSGLSKVIDMTNE